MKKKVGNACRTKNQIRNSKSRGAQFEYDVEYNLRKKFPGIYMTKERGFCKQYDLCSDLEMVAIECKFHAKMSWSKMLKYFYKLQQVATEKYVCALIVKTNRQPVLVMSEVNDVIKLEDFTQKFGILFEKHPSTRQK